MDVTQNSVKTVSNFVVSPETMQLIEKAREVSVKNNKIFVAAKFAQIIEVFNVCVRVPAATAKYLKYVPGHEIAVLNEKMSGLTLLELPDHYVHGDFLRRDEKNGKVKPKVIRHFMVNGEDLGKEIPCTVIIKEKNDLLTGERTIIIDILSQIGKSECDKTLRLGVPSLGIQDEVLIPETNLCIRFDAIEVKTMERSSKNEIPKNEVPVAAKIIKEVIEERPKLQLKKAVKKFELVTESDRFGKRIKIVLKKDF